MRHVIDLCHEGLYRPDIATLDCGSLNFGDSNRAYVSTSELPAQRGRHLQGSRGSSRNWKCSIPAICHSSSK